MTTRSAILDTQATQDTHATPGSRRRLLGAALWTAQVLLAALFGMAGTMKLTTPLAQLAAKLPWTAEVPALLVRFIGAAELAGALGLLLPALTRIRPRLTPWAAVGLATIMLLASLFHLARGEASVIGMNFAFGAVALFVAWGRFRKLQIASRSQA